MILKKLIQLAFLLKDVKEIDSIFEIKDGVKSFIPEKCDKVFNEDLIARICEIVTGVKAVNEVDALAGIADFFLLLRKQAKDSPNLKKLIETLPLPENLKAIFF